MDPTPFGGAWVCIWRPDSERGQENPIAFLRSPSYFLGMKTSLALAMVLSLSGCQQALAPAAQAPAAAPALKQAAVPTNASGTAVTTTSEKPAAQETESAAGPSRQVVTTTTQKSGEEPPKLRPSYDQCISAAGGVTPSMHDCIDAEYRFQDARLNTAYKVLMAKLGGKAEVKLRDAQRHWIATRDERCALDPDSGQAGALDAYECRLEMTATRAAELESR